MKFSTKAFVSAGPPQDERERDRVPAQGDRLSEERAAVPQHGTDAAGFLRGSQAHFVFVKPEGRLTKRGHVTKLLRR